PSTQSVDAAIKNTIVLATYASKPMSTNRTIERTSRSPVSWFGILKSCCVLTPFLVATDTVCSCESRWAVETCRTDCRLRDDKCPEQSVNAGSLPSSAKYTTCWH